MMRSWKRPVLRVAIGYSIIVAILCLLTFIFPPHPSKALFNIYGLLYWILFWFWVIFLIWWLSRFLTRWVLRTAIPFTIFVIVACYLLSDPGLSYVPATIVALTIYYGWPIWLGLWGIRLLWWLTRPRDRRPEIERPVVVWSIEPLMALVLLVLIYTNFPMKIRFAVSRPFFESAAQHCLAEGKPYDYAGPTGQDFMIGYFISSAELRYEDCVGFRTGGGGGFIYYTGDGDLPYLGTNSGGTRRLYGPWGYWSE